MGAEGELLDNSVIYGRILLCAIPFLILQFEFQSFFVTAEKPQLGLITMIVAGVTNMAFDALLTAVFPCGIVGAAVATALSQVMGGGIPLIYFLRKNNSLLRLGKTELDGKALLKASTNGMSELLSNISMSVVSMLYNLQLIKYVGENGIAAFGTLMYVNFMFLSISIGFVVGSAPIVSYHYGAGNTDELRGLKNKSTTIIAIASFIMLISAILLAKPLSSVYVGYDKELYELTVRAFYIYSFSFLFAPLAIYGSSFFTALNDGLVSAIISFLRTLIFETAAVLILPIFLQVDGIWLATVIAEFSAAAVTVIFIITKRKKYKY